MKLIINTSTIVGGGLQVALSFLEECKSILENEYHIFLSITASKQINQDIYPSNFFFYSIPSMSFYKRHRYLSKLEKNIKPDTVFTVFGPSYWRPKAMHVEGFARGYYIYPESPFWKKCTIFYRAKHLVKKYLHLLFFKIESDVLICETTDATDRIKSLLGDKKSYYTVSNTCNHFFENTLTKYLPYKLPEPQKDEFRFLILSKFYLHKNIEIIKPVIKELIKRDKLNVKFVLTIEPEVFDEIFIEYTSNIYNVGFLKSEECPLIYRECDAIFLPTLVECFSANYPEAMKMKKPILTSDLPFAKTICENSALYFDPLNVHDIVDKIIQLTENKTLYASLVNKGLKRIEIFPTARERALTYLNICKTK